MLKPTYVQRALNPHLTGRKKNLGSITNTNTDRLVPFPPQPPSLIADKYIYIYIWSEVFFSSIFTSYIGVVAPKTASSHKCQMNEVIITLLDLYFLIAPLEYCLI